MLESEFESEIEGLREGVGEGEGILGNIGNVLGGLLGQGEGEGEAEFHELHESEAGEQFFGRAFRGVRNLVKSAAPLLKRVASVAAPLVATAIGGPALGGIVGKVAGSLLNEGEAEGEMELHELGLHEGEFEAHELHEGAHELREGELGELHEAGLHELEGESELYEGEAGYHEVAHEIASHELTHHEALAEMMAQQAAYEQHEAEAEAMVGAAVVTTLSPRDRRELRRILPHLVRGVAILTRILRRRRITRPAVRAVPTVVRRTVQSLKSQAAAGRPITRRGAARTAAVQVRRVIGNPSACAAAISQNLRANRALRMDFLDAEWTPPEREDGNSCKMTWAVPEFAPGSSKLQKFQQQHIKDIVTRVVTTVARDVKGKKDVGIDFEILFEGHVDKNTDPQQYGELDSDRARNVSYEFIPRLEQSMNRTLPLMGWFGGYKYSRAGSTRPFSSNSSRNRRVVICVKWKVRPALKP
jgi:hypothetical protein